MDSSRESVGVVFFYFTLQIWGRGFDRGSAGVALRVLGRPITRVTQVLIHLLVAPNYLLAKVCVAEVVK